MEFLSIQAQDFIEEDEKLHLSAQYYPFLSIQAQDFIEEMAFSRACAIS